MEECPGGGPSCSASAASVSVCSSPPGDRLPASIPSSSPLSECVCVCAMILQSKVHGSLLLGVCWSLSHSPRSVVFVVVFVLCLPEFVILLGRSWI
jgi:hypothetical protein